MRSALGVLALLAIAVSTAACGSGGGNDGAGGSSATSRTVAGPTTSTTAGTTGSSTGQMPDANAVLTTRPLQAAVHVAMHHTDSSSLGSTTVLRSLCGHASPPSTSLGGWYEQFSSVPSGKALVANAVQRWKTGTLDSAWNEERAIVRSCTNFVSSGYPYTVYGNLDSDDSISLQAEDANTKVYLSDDLWRIGDVVVSLRMSWDAAAAPGINPNVTHLTLIDAAVAQAKKELGGG